MRSLKYLALTALLSAASSNALSDEVRILFTNNSNGKLVDCNCRNDPYGGMAERVTLVRAYREEHPDMILLDSGGYFGLTNIDRKGPVILRLMEVMEYDACGIGDQELYRSLGTFIEKYGWFSDYILNATIGRKPDSQVFQPYRIIECKGLKIGVIGIASGDTFRFFPDKSRDFCVANVDSVLEKELADIEKTCDYIIVLSQMGIDGDRKCAEKWQSIDLIIGGHSQTLLEEAVLVGNTRIVQAGKNAGRIGEVALIFDENNILDKFSYRLIEVTKKYTIEPDIRRLVEEAVPVGSAD